MKVILKKDVSGLGRTNDVLEVKPGYYRNCLLPKGFATHASKKLMEIAAKKREEMIVEKEKLLENAKDILEKLGDQEFVIKAKSSEKGKLYASLTEKDVINAVLEGSKINLEPEFIKMNH
ncbi:50S ribosomal protein L9, partial [Patescibacteria group bacterium]